MSNKKYEKFPFPPSRPNYELNTEYPERQIDMPVVFIFEKDYTMLLSQDFQIKCLREINWLMVAWKRFANLWNSQ